MKVAHNVPTLIIQNNTKFFQIIVFCEVYYIESEQKLQFTQMGRSESNRSFGKQFSLKMSKKSKKKSQTIIFLNFQKFGFSKWRKKLQIF